MSIEKFHLEVPNPDDIDEMPILDVWTDVQTWAKDTSTLKAGQYYAILTWPGDGVVRDVDESMTGTLIVAADPETDQLETVFRPY